MTEREALKLAMEGLERSVATCFDQYAHQQVMSRPDHFINQTITAIKEALEQPEQKPVAWIVESKHGFWEPYVEWSEPRHLETQVVTALYTAPPQPEQEPVAVTYQEVFEAMQALYNGNFKQQAIAVECGKLKLYITPPQREWVGLTDEEIDTWNIVGHESLREFVRAIEAKLKEKNT